MTISGTLTTRHNIRNTERKEHKEEEIKRDNTDRYTVEGRKRSRRALQPMEMRVAPNTQLVMGVSFITACWCHRGQVVRLVNPTGRFGQNAEQMHLVHMCG